MWTRNFWENLLFHKLKLKIRQCCALSDFFCLQRGRDKFYDLYNIGKIKENTANATDLLKREARRASYKAASQSDVSNASISNKNEKINQKTSKDIDSKYLELAKNPEQNREERQKMVDDAAKKFCL